MNKMYPFTGTSTPSDIPPGTYDAGGSWGERSGDFENIVRNKVLNMGPTSQKRFSALPDEPGVWNQDRDDEYYPDVIVIVTDGAPNGIISSSPTTVNNPPSPGTYPTGDVYEEFDSGTGNELYTFVTPMVWYKYPPGEAKLFRTPTFGRGTYLLDYATTSPPATNIDWTGYDPYDEGVEPYNTSDAYRQCIDGGSQTPAAYFSSGGLDNNRSPYIAMCNGSLIAEALKDYDRTGGASSYDPNAEDEDIYIMAIYVIDDGTDLDESEYADVGGTNFKEGAHWLKYYVVSDMVDPATGVPQGDKFFATITDYKDLKKTLLFLFEQLSLQEAR
jgi:hypothetical protein